MRTILKLILFLLSNLGYWEYFRDKHRISLHFAPVFTVAVQFTVLFTAGILNGLEEMTFGLYALGLLLCFRFLYRTKLRGVLRYCEPGCLYLLIAAAVAGVSVFGSRFVQIDNFTHWATVVRSMLFTDRFPNFKDVAVTFTTYPLGTAAYIYYFCRLTGDAEHFMMLAQAYMMLCAILPIFAFARKNRLTGMPVVGAMTLFLLGYNVGLADLRVDTVMPLAGMAAMAFAYYHCISGEEEQRLSLYYTFPMLLWVMNIKHAAVLYTVMAMILLLAGMERTDRRRKEWLILAVALLLSRQIWSMHCDYVYYEDSAGMHSMSADWFRYVLGDKTPEDIRRIAGGFLSYVTVGRNYFWLLAWAVVLTVLILWLGAEEKKRYAVLLGSAAVLYVVYAVGVLGMYIFSMPVWEGLNGAERYMKSADVSVYYIFALCTVMLLSGAACRKRPAAAAAVVALTLLSWNALPEQSAAETLSCTEEERQMVEQPLEEYGFGLGKSYLLCISEDMKNSMSDITRYIWRYNLLTDSVDLMVVTDPAQLAAEKDYDYVVIFDRENPVILQWMREAYPDRTELMIIQHFV